MARAAPNVAWKQSRHLRSKGVVQGGAINRMLMAVGHKLYKYIHLTDQKNGDALQLQLMEQHCYGLSLVTSCHWSLSKSILGNLGNLPNLGNNALLFQHNSKCPLLTATRVTIKAFSWLPLFAAGYSSHGGFGQLLRSHVQMANGWSQLASPWRRGPKGDLEGLLSGNVYNVHQKLLARQLEIYLPFSMGRC